MPLSTLNSGSSPFHTTLGLYCRSHDGHLLSVEGNEAQAITTHWPAIMKQLRPRKSISASLPSGTLAKTRHLELALGLLGFPSDQHHTRLHVREIYRPRSKCYVGCIGRQSQSGPDASFLAWIETLFISKTTLQPRTKKNLAFRHSVRRSPVARIWKWIKTLFRPEGRGSNNMAPFYDKNDVTERITILFNQMLRNTAMADEWETSGRAHFSRRIQDFVNRNEACQMILPAFPCKSPNHDKVGGSKPDMAERVALETLRSFVSSVEKIYPPGATAWIIHDGHLLSSCIGVDDDAISEYEANLQGLYRSMFDSPSDRRAIQFCGLDDLFFSDADHARTFNRDWLGDPELVQNPIQTNLSETADMARKIVMASCGINRSHLRKLIQAQDPSTLQSYRGLSRFMLQDLEGPLLANQSNSRKKRIAASVAAEMMARNQAYSNLLELLFPNYIRLSIHAHNNRGPKFGIRLFPKSKVRAIDDLDGRHEPVPLYEFQVPTPWHNSIIEVEGDDMTYVAKAVVARQAMESGRYTGSWIEEGHEGGHFLLRANVQVLGD